MPVSAGRLAPLAVVVLLVLAGCAGIGGDGTGGEAGHNVTPAPVPSAESTAAESTTTTDAAEADGVLTLGDIARLGAAYAARLQNDSYRLAATQRLRVDGEIVATSTLTRRVAAGGAVYIERVNRDRSDLAGTTIRYTNFYNGSIAATRYSSGGAPNYTFSTDPRPPVDLIGRMQLERFLRLFVVERGSNVPAAGPLVFVSDRIRYPRALATPVGTTDPRDGRLVLELYRNGTTVLRASYTVSVEGSREGTVVRTFRVDRLDNASVSAPPWVATARSS